MNTLLELALSNVLMAALLAVPAVLLGWWGRRPAWTHGLWLLVLLKLVTPPLIQVPILLPEAVPPAVAAPQLDDQVAALQLAPPDFDAAEPPAPQVEAPPNDAVLLDAPAVPVLADPVVAPAVEDPIAWTNWLIPVWLAGTLGWLLLAARRFDRFQRLLRFARPAPDDVQAEVEALAACMEVRCPEVLVLPGTISPMLWAVGRRGRLLVPAELLERLRPNQRATLLAHELAHWRRRDHYVRWLEVVALALYWWCPLVWWASRQLRQAEEECCDAWVVAVLPEAAREYALALVETIDFLSGAAPALPPVASGAGHVRRLQRRLTMILRGTTPQSLPRAGLLALAGLGLVLLPFVPGLAQPPPAPAQVQGELAARRAQLERELAQLRQAEAELAQAGAKGDEARLKQLHAELERAVRGVEAQHGRAEEQAEVIRRALQWLARQQAANPGAGRASGADGPSKTAAAALAAIGGARSVEQRLDQVEKKLDTLLWEVANLRKDINKVHAAPPAGNFFRPGTPMVPGGLRPAPPGGQGGGFGAPASPGSTPSRP